MKKVKHQEDQISNLCLKGSGIVCGLDIYVDEDYGVLIRAGNGLTSNGQYIEFKPSQWFRYYRPYENDTYPLFQDVDVWELTKHHNEGEPQKPQSSDEEYNPFLKNKVVLLFLDEDGQTGDPIVRPLLMDLDQLLEKLNLNQLATQILWQEIGDDDDFIYGDDYNPDDTRPTIHALNLAVNPSYRLPELYLRRFGFSSGDSFDCPPEGVDTSVFPCIGNLDDIYNAYFPIIDEALGALDRALKKLHHKFKELLDWNKHGQVQEWIELLCEKWETYKLENEEEAIGTKYYIQYFYDWARDLVQAYNELRQELIDLVAACCAKADAFPNHLLLGLALRDDLSRQPKPLRHVFRLPPIYNGNADRLQSMRLYSWRVLMMIKGFYLPDYIADEDINPYCGASELDDEDIPDFSTIKITPGKFYDAPLGEQTIPYYYPVTWSKYSVHHFWNYNRTKTSSTDHILSYHASDFEDSYTQVLSMVRPLHYSFNKYPFFRVEGHINRLLRDVFRKKNGQTTVESGVWSTLKYLKTKYNLPISFRFINVQDLAPGNKYQFPIIPDDLGENCQAVASYIKEESEEFCSLRCDLLGAEHQAGAKEGGTFLLIVQKIKVDELIGETEVVIADMFLPCCYNDCNKKLDIICIDEDQIVLKPTGKDQQVLVKERQRSASQTPLSKTESKPPPKEPGKKESKEAKGDPAAILLAILGKAALGEKDDLKAIKGIGSDFEEKLNDKGIYTYQQISKMTDETYLLLDELLGKINEGRAKKGKWAEKAKSLMKKKQP